MKFTGVKYRKDTMGRNRYLQIDLEKHGNNQLIEDFLDMLSIDESEGNETVSLDEFNRYVDEKLRTNVQCNHQ